MAPYGLANTLVRETKCTRYPKLSWVIKPKQTQIAVAENYDETYCTPKGSLDRLLRDSRFLSLLKTLNKVPRIMSWIQEACSGGCQICRNEYPEQRRMAILLCGHTMCDACLQRVMGDKMKSVFCQSCHREILLVLILDRPKKFCNLDHVRHFILQDDTSVHDPSLKLDSLVSLWRLGKEYPITMTPCSVDPVPALHSRKRCSKLGSPFESELKFVGKDIDYEEETYNRKSEAVIQSVLSHLGTDEDPFLPRSSPIDDGDLIDWDRVFTKEDYEFNANSQHVSSRPYNLTQVFGGDVRMDCNFLNFETSGIGKPCNNEHAEKRENQTCSSETLKGVTLPSDGVEEQSIVSGTFLSSLRNLIDRAPMNYMQTESSNCFATSFISNGKILRRRLECPQWIMRVQVIPVIFESKMDDLIQLD